MWVKKTWWIYFTGLYGWLITGDIWRGDYRGALEYVLLVTFIICLDWPRVKKWFKR